MKISGNQFLVKNKAIQGQGKVGDKTSIVKSEGETPAARSEQIKDSSVSSKDAQLANEVINSARNVRAGEVARVKAKIKNGYNVDSRMRAFTSMPCIRAPFSKVSKFTAKQLVHAISRSLKNLLASG